MECQGEELSSCDKEMSTNSDDELLNRIMQFESRVEALQALKPTLYEAISLLEDKDETTSPSNENASTSSEEQQAETIE
jgi:hypothetical protein